MPFDPSADPWGAAMLGCGVLVFLSLVLTTILVATRTSAFAGRLLLGLSMLGFLGSAVLGTAVQIRAGTPVHTADVTDAGAESTEGATDSGTPAASDEPKPPGDPEPLPGEVIDTDDTADPGREATADEATPEDEDAAADAVDPPPDPDLAPPPRRGPAVAPLPDDPEALLSAARQIIRDGRTVVGDPAACKSLDAVGEIWTRLAAVPPDVLPGHREQLARKLEKCRKTLVWTTTYALHQRRIREREALADAVAKRLSTDEIQLMRRLRGKDKNKLRLGSGNLTQEIVDRWTTDGLQEELENAGFANVTFSDGRTSWHYDLRPGPEHELVAVELAHHGLDAPLELP